MKLSEYIKHLQEQVDKHGDVEVVKNFSEYYNDGEFEVIIEEVLGEVLYFKDVNTRLPDLVSVCEGDDVSGLTKAYCI